MKTVSWSSQKINQHGLIELDGEFTFDFFNDKDRSRWFGAFESEKNKRETGDRFFASKELVAGDYIKQATENNFNVNIIPKSIEESPRSFLYNDLIGRMAFEKNFIIPLLRKTGIFSPITENMERMFFTFDQQSYNIDIIEIPDRYQMRKIFKVTFKVYFDIKKYLDYLIIKKKAKFELHIWPDCYIKMTYTPGWPLIFVQDKINFYNSINALVLETMRKNPSIVNYIYSTIKVRVDRVQGLKIELDHTGQHITIRTSHVMSLIQQFIAGKIDIFNTHRVNSSFNIQKIEPTVIERYGITGNTSGAALLMYFYALRIAGQRSHGSHVNPKEIEKIMKDIKSGKIKISEVK